jgi:hypothetical protein
MHDNFTVLDIFEYSTEAQVTKTKLDAEGLQTMLMDEKTIDSDPLISQAIGGVKLLVHNDDLKEARRIYNRIRTYATDENDQLFVCPNCSSNKVLIAPLQRKNVFYMLFPFFEKTRKQCNVCNTIF